MQVLKACVFRFFKLSPQVHNACVKMQVGRKKRVFNNLKKTKTLKNLKQKWNYKIPRLEDLQLKTLHTNMKYLAATHGSIWGN